MKYVLALILVCLSAVLVRAQTRSVVDADGDTIVEVITVDPVAGLATTETLSTLTGTTATTAATTAPVTQNQGPVAQPAATQTGQTIFTYTTTDALGDTTAIVDTFTPTSITGTVTPTLSFTGTVLNYSSWLAMVGTNTVADSNLASGAVLTVPTRAWVSATALLAGIVGGAWIVL